MLRKLHVARGESELGILTEAETQELLQAGFLLPTDVYWAEGMADWESLSDFKLEPKDPRRPAALLKLAKRVVKSAGTVTAAHAARLSSGWKSAAVTGQLRWRATARVFCFEFMNRRGV